MQISFVIPAYNEEGVIGKCLASVKREIERTPCGAEIIVVNNASTDQTGAVARAVPGVMVVDEPRKGLVRARAAGYAASHGDIIANVDADTELPHGWLKKALTAFEHDPKLVALSGPFVYYDLPFFERMLASLFITTYPLMNFLMQYVFRVGAVIQGGNFVLRRSALQKIGGFDTSIEFYGEDTDIARRISKVGRVKWTLGFPMYASGRRLAKEGLVAVGFRYTLNYFWTIFFGKPFTRTYKDIRPQ